MKGLFIVLEGPDGSGKSTMAKRILKYLENNKQQVELVREPGGTRISEKVREIILDNENKEMKATTEALLYAASRAQLVGEKIKPFLEEGKTIVCERFVYSSLVYQGIGRKLGIDNIKMINDFGLQGVKPDIVLFFDINPEKALKRKTDIGGGDRLEQEDISFHKAVFNGYKEVINRYPQTILIDADRTKEEIFKDIKEIIDKRL